MNQKALHHVAGRLSLRAPQRESLETLATAIAATPDMLNPKRDVPMLLETLKGEFPKLSDFEREFPSLCFALATGVGKTRLMGAFIRYLYLAHGISHFFVLAPNLTIYNKLIADFTPNTPKYVFKGIAEFAVNSPKIITGDDYKEPFTEKMRVTLTEMADSELFKNALQQGLDAHKISTDIVGKIESVIDKRLSELTPQLVKEMVQAIIHEHLGWLVVWGGIFGGLMGALFVFA